ncbi:MAG: hypothetical protein AAGB93_12350 [Planctomycetota bacterium]
MQRSRWIAVVSVPVALAVAAWIAPTVVERGDRATRRPAEGAGAEGEAHVDLAGLTTRDEDGGPAAHTGTSTDIVAPAREPRSRVSAAPPAPQPSEDAATSRALVMGVVTDADGVPFPGIDVTLREQGADLFFSGLGGLTEDEGPSTDDASFDPSTRTVTTDAKGAFTFENSLAEMGGSLDFGRPVLLAGARSAAVDRKADWQILRLPRFPRQDALWTVEVIDAEGMPVVVEDADLELVALDPAARAARAPWPGERVVTLGSIVQRGLARGTWRMSVTPERALTTSVEWTVEAEDSVGTSRIVVELPEGAYAADTGPTLGADGASWVDPASGLLEWLPENRVSVGEDAVNRHVAQTLSFGPGEVRSAQLTLRLRAMLLNADNDGLYLEHRGERTFAWSARIDDLVRPRWKQGATATLRLDLARLPRKGAAPFDLRPFLEDGKLDVVVQDDTTIDGLSIRVLR